MNKLIKQKLTALFERGLYEQQCLNNQILAFDGEPENIQDDTLRHQVTVLLWHSREMKGYFKSALKVVENEFN